MTLRETIAREIEPEAFDAFSPEKVASLSTMYGGTWYPLWAMSCGPLFTRIQTAYDRADAILAAIREHMTSPEAVERAYMAGTLEMSPEENMREAILAALEGEP